MEPVVTFRGGRIRVDSRARVVLVDGRPAKLGGRAFDVLDALIRRSDRVVPKQELLDVVWPGLVVEENNLQVHVMSLRKLLGTDSIRTVSGRGYQFTLWADAGPDAQTVNRPVVPERTEAEAAPGTTLIGRDELIASTCALLLQEGVRLVTLTGAGGSGKTRVALRVSADLAHEFDDGSYVVMLAPVRDAAHVSSAIAAAFDVQESGSRRLEDLIVTHLRDRSLLLTLDNFEHVITAGSFIAELLDGCPRLTVLVTSRIRLHVGAEREVPVPPLAVPPSRASDAQALLAPAVRLFIDRARATGHPVGAQASEVAAVAEICRQLDGLPLAIELAVARLRVLTPGELVQRLGHRLAILKTGARDVPDRQKTLRDAIAWSYGLLNADEQNLFRRLAVFVGGWTLSAAERVAAAAGASADLLDTLSALIDHNLVQRIDDVDGEGRFTMLETVREYAAEQFEASQESDDVRAVHAQYFIALVSSVEPRLRGGGRAPWLARMRAEYHNVRAALIRVLVEVPDTSASLKLTGTLTWFWYFTAQFSEGRGWMKRALALPGADPATAARATVLSGAARLAFYSGALDEAAVLATESIALFRAIGDRQGLGYALFHFALSKALAEDKAACLAGLEEAAECFRDAGDEWGSGLAAAYHGVVLAVVPNREQEASLRLEKARARARALGDNWLLAGCAHYLGSIALRHGDFERARMLTEEALVGVRELSDTYRESRMLHQLAEIALAAGRPTEALATLQQSLAITHAQGRTGDLALQLRLLAGIRDAQSKPEEAVRFAAAASRLAGHSVTMPPDDRAAHQRLCDSLRARLGNERYDLEWEIGSALPIGETVQAALSAEA